MKNYWKDDVIKTLFPHFPKLPVEEEKGETSIDGIVYKKKSCYQENTERQMIMKLRDTVHSLKEWWWN